MDMKNTAILGGCIVAAALVFSLAPRSMSGSALAAGGSTGPTMRVQSPDGNLKVRYSVQTSPTTAEGGTYEGISDIEFYGAFVVVKSKEGNGFILYHERTRELTWSVIKR